MTVVSVVDQFRDDDEQNCKAELAFPVSGTSVCGPSELPKIGEPGVRPFDGPAEPHGVRSFLGHLLFGFGFPGFAFLVDHDVGEPEGLEECSDGACVVALVEVESADVEVEVVVPQRHQGGFQQWDVVSVRSVECPRDRDADCVGPEGPFVTKFPSVYRAGAGSFPTAGCFVE